jgi:hypothetical protein
VSRPQDGETAGAEAPTVLLRGRPTAAEAAAVLVALTAVSQENASAAASAVRGQSLWNSRMRAARPPLAPGPGAWRASRLPR